MALFYSPQSNPTEQKITFGVIGLERDPSGRESHKVQGSGREEVSEECESNLSGLGEY